MNLKFYHNPEVNEYVKRTSETTFFYIQVAAWSNGDFVHQRGHASFETPEECQNYLENYKEVSKKDYIEAGKAYFAIDKKVREEFIKQYNL